MTVARFTDQRVEKLLQNPGIVRNRLKVESAVTNARAFLAVQDEWGSFARYIWDFVDGCPIQNTWQTMAELPATTVQVLAALIVVATVAVAGRSATVALRLQVPIMALVGCTSLFGLVWVLGGLVTIFGAVIYAELAAMMPRSGGPYEYLKTAYHPFWAFLRGWAMFFVSETASIAAVALIFGEYLNALWMIVYGEPFNRAILYTVALGTIWLLTWVNLYGVHMSGIVQNFFGFVKIAAVGSIIGVAFTSWSSGSWSNFADPLFPEAWTGSTILAVGSAVKVNLSSAAGTAPPHQ